MPRVMLTARVTDAQAAALRSYAEDVGLPLYQATVRALEIGIATLTCGPGQAREGAGPAAGAGDAAGEIGALRAAVEQLADRLTVRAELTERLVQRTLYASGAAYAAAIDEGGGQGQERLARIARDADRIFDRQLAKAREG